MGRKDFAVLRMIRSELKEIGVSSIGGKALSGCKHAVLYSKYIEVFKSSPTDDYAKLSKEQKEQLTPPAKKVLTAALCAIGEKESDLKGLNLPSLCNIHIALTGAKYVRDGKEKYIKTDKQAHYYSKRVYKGSIRSNGRENYKIKYRMYLLSPEWRNKRKEVLMERNNKCERCGSNKKLEVHHKTYERIFNENLSDLELLCKTCHEKEHNIVEVIQTA